jgi:hypothetical protein
MAFRARERDVSPLQNEGDESDPRGGKEGGGGTVAGGPWREGEDDNLFADFANDLRKRGLGRDQITKAIGLAKDYLRRKGGAAHDRLPKRAGHFEKSRFDRSDREVDQIHKLMERFEPGEAGYAADRNRHAHDAAPPMSEKRRVSMYQKFPGLSRIGDMMSDTPPGADLHSRTTPSQWEV